MKKLRKSNGFTQKQIAEKMGLTVGYISEIESGKKNLSVKKMKELAEIYDVRMEVILRKLGYITGMRRITISEKKGNRLVASITDDEIILHDDYTVGIEILP